MATATTKINGNVDSVTSANLADQMDVLRKDLNALTDIITDLGRAKGEEAIAAAKAKVDGVREKATDTADTARLQAMELQKHADDFMRSNPATALGIAAGIGFLVGFMGSRK
jgi:ElaB/YqjD/DUF883 family membrane-anchored ribosome-binding protein